MLFTRQRTVADQVIELLQSGSQPTTTLVDLLQSSRVTKQAIYQALRLLVDLEVIVIHKKQVSLNIRWLNDVDHFVSVSQGHAAAQKETEAFLQLKPRQKLKYTFKNLATADAFWNHALHLLLTITDPKEPWFGYDPHAWFFLVRLKDEKALIRSITKSRPYLLSVGHRTAMDRLATKWVDQEKSQYHMFASPLFPDEGYYFNIVGDFLVEVFLEKESAEAIHAWYGKTLKLTEEARAELEQLIRQSTKVIIVLSRNQKKVTQLKAKLKKYFYLKK